jgi:hypothetical protein
MHESLKISWQADREDVSHITYFINSGRVGEDDEGFEKILQAINNEPSAEVIIKINQMHGLGGEKLEDHLPFKKRYDELINVLGERKLIYEIF